MHGHLQGRRPAERHLGGRRCSLEGLGLSGARIPESALRVLARGDRGPRRGRAGAPDAAGRAVAAGHLQRRGLLQHTLAQLMARRRGLRPPRRVLRDGLPLPTAERRAAVPGRARGLSKLGLDGGDGRLLGAADRRRHDRDAGPARAGASRGRAPGCSRPAWRPLYPTLIAADGAMMTESLVRRARRRCRCCARLPAASRRPAWAARWCWACSSGSRPTPAPRRCCCSRCCWCRCCAARRRARRPRPCAWRSRWCSRPGRRATGRCFDRPVLIATEGGETLAGANCEHVYYGDGSGTWVLTCVHFTPRGDEATEVNEAGRDGVGYALRPRRLACRWWRRRARRGPGACSGPARSRRRRAWVSAGVGAVRAGAHWRSRASCGFVLPRRPV